MKKKILYIGNQLSRHGLNKTTIETLGPDLEKEGFTLVYASDKRQFLFRLLAMVKTTLFSRSVDYVLIDTYSTTAFWYAFVCSQIARFRKMKYIPILHGGNLPLRLENQPRIARMVFKNAYQNVAPSNYLKAVFENQGYTNVMYISNTIPLQHYTFKKRSVFQPKLLWVRAFASIYNPQMAVLVFATLKKKYSNATLTMVGPDKDGSLKQTKQLADTLGVDVNFTGQLSKEAWWNLAAEHDIFINTTHFDNTPVSLIEVMALGLPIVSTNVGGIPYLVENNKQALLVNDDKVEEMVGAIEVLIENPILANEMVLEANNLASSFNWDVVKLQWEILLQ